MMQEMRAPNRCSSGPLHHGPVLGQPKRKIASLDLLGLSTLSRKALCFSKFAAAFSCNHLRTFRYEGEVLSEGGPDAYLSNRYSTEAT